ncbi:hypothetical protein PAXINDRAFT_102890 [Paxillus involutus ATCC 200175]|uniref:Uncharacterized protein n=1 Tax=Paxillus involutus ATCC 200175 TaxID=664439 RepID=A0A0C9TI45_PAXIN|nr:hypothetical protein PAXINDRAFT_102890 [Paxillus involutus ATCC 200175]
MAELFAAASLGRFQGGPLEDIGLVSLPDSLKTTDSPTPHNASSAATVPRPPPSGVRSLSQDSQVAPPQDNTSELPMQFGINAVDTPVWARALAEPFRPNIPIQLSDDEFSDVGDHTPGQESYVVPRQSQQFTPASGQTTRTVAQPAGTPEMVAGQATPHPQEPIQDDREKGFFSCCFK